MERAFGAAVAAFLGLIVWTVALGLSSWALKRWWPKGYAVLFKPRYLWKRSTKKPAPIAETDPR